MAYLVIDREGNELIFDNCPEYNRVDDCWQERTGDELAYRDYNDFDAGVHWIDSFFYGIELPNGTIKKLIGKDLTLNDDPVKI